MTYRVQIITAKGEPVIDARVWSYDEAVALRADHSQQSKVCRWKYPGDKRWRYMVAMAMVGNVVPFSLIAWGQQRIDSGLAGILMAVMPLATIVLAHFTVSGERLDLRRATSEDQSRRRPALALLRARHRRALRAARHGQRAHRCRDG